MFRVIAVFTIIPLAAVGEASLTRPIVPVPETVKMTPEFIVTSSFAPGLPLVPVHPTNVAVPPPAPSQVPVAVALQALYAEGVRGEPFAKIPVVSQFPRLSCWNILYE